MNTFTPRPHRLSEIYPDYCPPLYFVTFCTFRRCPLLANPEVHSVFTAYSELALPKASIAVGRYVIMPDHVHIFVKGPDGFGLGSWIKGLKHAITMGIRRMGTSAPHQEQGCKQDPVWQDGFFDHIIRNSESYGEKWTYVRDNPVRKKLVVKADDWPYQGEITIIDRV